MGAMKHIYTVLQEANSKHNHKAKMDHVIDRIGDDLVQLLYDNIEQLHQFFVDEEGRMTQDGYWSDSQIIGRDERGMYIFGPRRHNNDFYTPVPQRWLYREIKRLFYKEA